MSEKEYESYSDISDDDIRDCMRQPIPILRREESLPWACEQIRGILDKIGYLEGNSCDCKDKAEIEDLEELERRMESSLYSVEDKVEDMERILKREIEELVMSVGELRDENQRLRDEIKKIRGPVINTGVNAERDIMAPFIRRLGVDPDIFSFERDGSKGKFIIRVKNSMFSSHGHLLGGTKSRKYSEDDRTRILEIIKNSK